MGKREVTEAPAARAENTEADALARKALEKSRQVDADLPPDARRHAPPTSYRLK